MAYDPIVVKVGQFVGELLVVVRPPVGVVFDNVEHGRRHSALTHRLTDEVEVVALLSSDHCVDDSSGHWVLELSFAHFLHESGVNAFGDDNERQFDVLRGGADLLDGLLDLSQLVVEDVLDLALGNAVAIYNQSLRQFLIDIVITFETIFEMK